MPIGQPYNPATCFQVNQLALNANQFEPTSPAKNNDPSIIVWDTDLNLLQRVSTLTNIVLEELGGSGTTYYKQSQLPNVSINPQSEPRPDLYGDAIDLGPFFGSYPFIRLSNGNLASVQYCQSVLKNGILIYEAYDIQTLDPINGYWVAFKQNETNPKLLEKVAELKMTQQFWDNWYDWTLKNEGNNVVKFVGCNSPFADNILIQSWITKLTYNNGVLTAEDSSFNFGGATVLSLYNSLSGYGILSGTWDYVLAEYILDDDYSGMANGKEVGWCYYRDSNGFDSASWDCVGFNILTGQTRWITTATTIASTVTNFDLTGFDYKSIIDWIAHPNGVSFSFADQNIIDNGNNYNGVTCLWSPYFQNPNNVLYINTRDSTLGSFLFTSGFIDYSIFYWDNINFYATSSVSTFSGQTTLVQRFNTNTKEIKSWHIPMYSDINFGIGLSANNNGVVLITPTKVLDNSFGKYIYYYITQNFDYWSLQSNNLYATNLLENKSYSTSSTLLGNVYSVGIELDEHTGVDFSNN